MRKTAIFLGLLLTLFMLVQTSNAQDKIEVFGGYSFARAPISGTTLAISTPVACPIPGCPPTFGNFNVNSNGWEATGVFKPNKWLGVAADFSGYYGSAFGSSVHLQNYLFGPQVSLPGHISPFAHVLFGVAHETAAFSKGTAFSSAIGGGVDLKLNRLASIRLVQVDYLLTRFGGLTQNEIRVSTGLVLHF